MITGGKAGKAIKGFGDANRMVFRAYNGIIKGKPSYSARLVGIVNGQVVAVADDAKGGELNGQDTTFSISSKNGANGAYGSFSGIVMRIPNPF